MTKLKLHAPWIVPLLVVAVGCAQSPEERRWDIYELAAAGHTIPETPSSLGEAIDALEKDHEFLLRDGVFTRDVIDSWLHVKRHDEIDYIRLRPHPGEFSLYFNV